MKYNRKQKKHVPKTTVVIIVVIVAISAAVAGAMGTRLWYERQLQPVASVSKIQVFEVKQGATVQEIAETLKARGLIRSSQAFLWYVRNNDLSNDIKAGVYELDASKSVTDIVSKMTDGDIQEDLLTIIPGSTIDQVKSTFIDNGYSAAEVEEALNPDNYANHPALVSKPKGANLEGYLYPESFQATSNTPVKAIIEQSLDQMAAKITPELIAAWNDQGLTPHEAVTLASIVENEVTSEQDRRDVAAVFINRLKNGMPLQSDPTYIYAAKLLGVEASPKIESKYNTYFVPGLPEGPISNVSESSLKAVAFPAQHEFLYFVAGDDGITRFSKTLEEHEALTEQYCKELCKSY